MEDKCDVDGCEEKATMHVTELAGGKVITAHVCGQHATNLSGAGQQCKAFHAPKRDPAVLAKLADLFVPQFCQGMRDADPGVRAHCAWWVIGLGAAASTAIPTLRSLMDDPDEAVREAAARALEWIESATTKS